MPRGRKKGEKVNPLTGKVEKVSAPVVENKEVEFAEVNELPEVEIPTIKKEVKKKDTFEFKDRYYHLKGDKTPVSYILKSKKLMWYDESVGYEREIMFTENQKTPFVDEFKGEVRPAHIIFRDGLLRIPKEKVVQQKILSIYHKDLGRIYLERNEEKDAMDELDLIELELEAMNLCNEMDISKAESIVRMDVGSKVSTMSSKEIKRDLMLLCKKNPQLVIELAEDDSVEARNLGIKAVEQGILKLSADHRTFFLGSNNRKLFSVPFDEHPYSALVNWFKTDEGLEVYAQLEKRVV